MDFGGFGTDLGMDWDGFGWIGGGFGWILGGFVMDLDGFTRPPSRSRQEHKAAELPEREPPRLDLGLDVAGGARTQDEVAVGALELDVVDELGAGAHGRRGGRAGHGGDPVLRQDDGLVVLVDDVILRLLMLMVMLLVVLLVMRLAVPVGGESATPVDGLVLVVLVRRRHHVSRCAVAPPHR